LVLAVQHFLERDLLAGVRGHAAHGGHQAGFHTPFDFVVGFVIADGVNQVVPFIQIRILLVRVYFGCPEHAGAVGILALVSAGGQSTVVGLRDDRHAFAALREAVVSGLATHDAAPVHDELAAVGEGVFHGVVVEVLVHVITAIMAAAQRLGLDRRRVLLPAIRARARARSGTA